MTPAKWTDSEGREWSTAINVHAIQRARNLVGVNLVDAFDGKLFVQLADDPVLLVNTIYAVCKPQADDRNISDEEFGALLVGDAIDEAAEALAQGVFDFFPRNRREVLRRLWTKTAKARSAATELATSKLNSPRIDEALEAVMKKTSDEIDRQIDTILSGFGDISGNSPEASASTPAP